MKTASARNWQGLVWVGLVVAAVAMSGCFGTVHGGGVVSLESVSTGSGPGVPTDANVAVSAVCNDRKDELLATIHWTDNANGANFTAHLPWTPVASIPPGISTCEDAAQIVSEQGFSVTVGIINSHGQQSGAVAIAVSVPGVDEGCGGLQRVTILAQSPDLPGGSYTATGCLDHGKIVFQSP